MVIERLGNSGNVTRLRPEGIIYMQHFQTKAFYTQIGMVLPLLICLSHYLKAFKIKMLKKLVC